MHTPSRMFSSGPTFLFCFLAALAEGYDLQSAAIAMQKLVVHFELGRAQTTWIPTSNVVGLFIGAALGGWLADRTGRKTVLVTSMIAFGLFSMGTALAADANMLIAMRFLTGLGLGGAMPNIIALTAEASRPQERALRVTLLTAGIPFGGALVPLIALILGPEFDWRTIFWVGGVFPVLVGVVMIFLLPESAAYAAMRVQRAAAGIQDRRSVATALFGAGRALPTLLLWSVFLMTLLVLYLLLNWLPFLMSGMGFTPGQAAKVSFAFTVGGGFGALALGVMMDRLGSRITFIVTYLAMAVAIFLLAQQDYPLFAVLLIAFAVGFFVIGSQFMLYGITPTYYPLEVRATGIGWAIAIGRIGAVIGPLFAGKMLEAGIAPQDIILAVLPAIVIALVAAIALIVLGPNSTQEVSE